MPADRARTVGARPAAGLAPLGQADSSTTTSPVSCTLGRDRFTRRPRLLSGAGVLGRLSDDGASGTGAVAAAR